MNLIIKKDFKIAPLTWLKVGGTVNYLFLPKSIDEIQFFLKEYSIKNPGLLDNIIILGAISNSLILDGNINGTVIKTTYLNKITLLENNQIKAECGALDQVVSNFAYKNSIGGLEFLNSIPGSIGGNIKTNAGCYGSEIADILVECEAITRNGDLVILKPEDLQLSYRSSIIPDNILLITSVILQGKSDTKENILQKMNTMEENRKNSQPIGISTCGCTFKNPEGKKAWELIKEAGCDKLQYKNVTLSKKHYNFLHNTGNSGSDIYDFCEMIRGQVLEKTKYKLSYEIFIYGNK